MMLVESQAKNRQLRVIVRHYRDQQMELEKEMEDFVSEYERKESQLYDLISEESMSAGPSKQAWTPE